jgi:hypothetical protein
VIEAAPQRVVSVVRTRAYLPALWLGVVVVASAVVRAWVARFHAGPAYFPDEYLYSELGRSLAAHGHPLVRGESAHFAPLLAAIVTAPGWLFGTTTQGYHVVQAIDSLAMSLAAVPSYLLVRFLGLGRRSAFAGAALALLAPGLLYSSFMLSEPIAYPLVLAAAATAVRALSRPTPRTIAAFLVFAGLATFARMQFGVLLPCYLAALVAVLVRERRLVSTLRAHWRAAVALLALTGAFAAVGPARSTGYYPSFLHTSGAGHMLSELAVNGLVLVYAAGAVVIPGAILGVVLAIARPRSRDELAFGTFAAVTTVALLLEASLYGDTGVAQERYAFYLLPLWFAAFLLYANRGWPKRLVHALLGVLVVVAVFSTPLTTEAFGPGKMHSPVLFAVTRLQLAAGDAGTTSSIAALIVVGALLLVLAASAVPAARTPVAVGAAGAVMLLTTVGAYAFDAGNTKAVRSTFVGADPAWVDALGTKNALLLATPGNLKTDTLEQLFWNRSVDRLALLPGAKRTDLLSTLHANVRADGTLVVAGKPVTSPVLVNEYGSSVQFRNAARLGADPTSTLVRPHGALQLRLLAVGAYSNGWFARSGVLYVWPSARDGRIAGRISLRLHVPEQEGTVTVGFNGRGIEKTVVVRPGANEVELPVCTRGPVAIRFGASRFGGLGDGRVVFAQGPAPRFTPDPAACTV